MTELGASLGELVDLGACRRSAPVSPDDPGSIELAQPLGKDVFADRAEAVTEFVEALGSEQQLSDDEQGPSLADYVECSRAAARVVVGALGLHM